MNSVGHLEGLKNIEENLKNCLKQQLPKSYIDFGTVVSVGGVGGARMEG